MSQLSTKVDLVEHKQDEATQSALGHSRYKSGFSKEASFHQEPEVDFEAALQEQRENYEQDLGQVKVEFSAAIEEAMGKCSRDSLQNIAEEVQQVRGDAVEMIGRLREDLEE